MRGRRQTNAETARFVGLLCQLGPDIPTIAHKLGQYKETVRYRYKNFLLGRGMPVQANVDHQKLGLQRIIVVLEFMGGYEKFASEMLMSMSETCYVSGFEKTVLEGFYVVHASVPLEYSSDFENLFRRLETEGVFALREFRSFEVYTRQPMRAAFYDFVANRWDYDWAVTLAGKAADMNYHSPGLPTATRLDYRDLLILKELQIDAARPISALARKLGLNQKTLHWHFRKHVLGNGLIEGYTVRWLGTKYEPKTERIAHRKHRYLRVDLLAVNLSSAERMELVAMASLTPFLWAEAIGDGYYAQFAFPVDMVVEAYEYLGRVLSKFQARVRVFVMDQTNAVNFTISHNLFDRERQRWTFDGNVISKYVALAAKIRESGPV